MTCQHQDWAAPSNLSNAELLRMLLAESCPLVQELVRRLEDTVDSEEDRDATEEEHQAEVNRLKFDIRRLTARGCRVYSEPAPAKSGAGFGDPNRVQARKRRQSHAGAFFVPACLPAMVMRAGRPSGLPGSCTPVRQPRACRRPSFGEEGQRLNLNSVQETDHV